MEGNIEQILNVAAKNPNSGVKKCIKHFIPVADNNGVLTGKIMTVSEPSVLYDRIMSISGGVLPSI